MRLRRYFHMCLVHSMRHADPAATLGPSLRRRRKPRHRELYVTPAPTQWVVSLRPFIGGQRRGRGNPRGRGTFSENDTDNPACGWVRKGARRIKRSTSIAGKLSAQNKNALYFLDVRDCTRRLYANAPFALSSLCKR